MAYRVEVGPRASIQLEKLNATVLSAVERKIIWLAQNAAVMVHRRLRWYARRSFRAVQATGRRLAHSLLDLSRGENRAYLSHSAPVRSVSSLLTRCAARPIPREADRSSQPIARAKNDTGFTRLRRDYGEAGIAIDRFDGTIVGQQLEEVTE